MDDEGQPVVGEVELTYAIYDHPTEGAVVWQDVVDVELDDSGFYSVQLGGEANPIDSTVLADGDGWLGVAVDGGDELEPRVTLNSVPYAVVAGEALVAGEAGFADEAAFAEAAQFAEEAEHAEQADFAEQASVAESVEAGSIGSEALADDFTVDAEHIEEATGDTLGGLSCANGDIARFDGNNWGCDDAVAHAETADEADHAETADHADEADFADEADHAETADHADEADFADEADHAATAAVADEVEDGSITADSLSSDFSVAPGQVDGQMLEGLSCANGDVPRFDGNDWFCEAYPTGTVTDVSADGPLASSGGTEPNISIAQADADTDGYLASEDFASFDDRVESVEEGDGISIAGSDASPEVGVAFGDEEGTAVEGNDPRLSDERDPTAGSDHYIQNAPDSPQDASISIDGDAEITGDVEFGGNLVGTVAEPVAFSATLSSHNTTSGTLVFDDVKFNIGDHYDPSNGEFTAPVDGIYTFSIGGYTRSSDTGNRRVSIYINNNREFDIWDYLSSRGSLDRFSDSHTRIIPLEAGDTLHVEGAGSQYRGGYSDSNHGRGFHMQGLLVQELEETDGWWD